MAIAFQQLWLIIAGKDDRVAQSLTGALRMAGERAILVDTPEMIQAYAAATAICIVVFSSDGSPADMLAVASKLRFVAHIPILDDSRREVPIGPWACQPIAVQHVDATLVTQLREQLHEIIAAGDNGAIESGLAEPLTLPPTKSERQARRLRYLRITSSVLIVIALLFNVASTWFGHSNSVSYTYQPPPTYPIGVGYSVHVPGTCDKTTTVNWEITGNNTVICRQDGMLMERDDVKYNDMTQFSVNEDKPELYFGKAYSVQTRMQFIRNDTTTYMGLDTLEQTGYDLGSIAFFICGDGHWEIYLFDPDGIPTQLLKTGTLAHPQTTYTMRVTIQANTMTMQLDGVTITALPDPAYTTTLSLSLITTELGDSTIVSQVLFSDFSVQPITTTS